MITRRQFVRIAAGAAVSPALLAQSPGIQGSGAGPVRQLKVLLGDYPHTLALKQGQVRSASLALQFVPATPVYSAFKRTVRDLEFDVSELALVTYLQARAFGKPLILLPAVMFSRYQHPYLLYDAQRGLLTPQRLEGRRIGIRLYTSTTGTWLRGILSRDFGVKSAAIQWLTTDQPNLAEFTDPANVVRHTGSESLVELLYRGAVDAIIVDPIPPDPRLKPVIPAPADAAASWREHNHALQINHMVVVREELTRTDPGAVREMYRMLRESKQAAAPPAGEDGAPFGLSAMRHSLDVAIDYVHDQGLIPRRFAVDELFNDVTGTLE